MNRDFENKKFEDLTDEEIRKMGQDILEQREEMRLANQRFKIIKDQFEANELPDIKPLWHIEKNEINFSLQTEQLDDELMKEINMCCSKRKTNRQEIVKLCCSLDRS